MLQAPQSPQDGDENFVYQVCISGSTDKEPFRTIANGTDRATNDERLTVIRNTAQDFAEPFRSFLSLVPNDANVKQLDLDDWAFPNNSSATGSITLVGDAAHAMTMCKYRIELFPVQRCSLHNQSLVRVQIMPSSTCLSSRKWCCRNFPVPLAFGSTSRSISRVWLPGHCRQ